jgi:Tol biopolymer transport system component
MSTLRRRRLVSKRLPSLVAAACVLGVAATSLSSAAPVYTDWSAPVNLGPVVNSALAETGPALSPDGLSLYLNRQVGGTLDIFVSQRATLTSDWGAPVNLGPTVNTTSPDFVTSFTPDGHWMILASGRPGGFGGADLYQSYRADIHDDFAWQTPTNLGANINTSASENGNGIFDNGTVAQLFFASDRLGPAGSGDIYTSTRQPDGSWGPVSLVPELSSPGTDNRPNLRADGLEIFFYSDRAGSLGGSDIWTSTRTDVTAAWSTPVNLGATVNSTAGDTTPSLSADGRTLIFASGRPGGQGTDLYMMTREQIFPASKDDCKNDGWERFGIYKNQGDCVSYVATGGTNEPG